MAIWFKCESCEAYELRTPQGDALASVTGTCPDCGARSKYAPGTPPPQARQILPEYLARLEAVDWTPEEPTVLISGLVGSRRADARFRAGPRTRELAGLGSPEAPAHQAAATASRPPDGDAPGGRTTTNAEAAPRFARTLALTPGTIRTVSTPDEPKAAGPDLDLDLDLLDVDAVAPPSTPSASPAGAAAPSPLASVPRAPAPSPLAPAPSPLAQAPGAGLGVPAPRRRAPGAPKDSISAVVRAPEGYEPDEEEKKRGRSLGLDSLASEPAPAAEPQSDSKTWIFVIVGLIGGLGLLGWLVSIGLGSGG